MGGSILCAAQIVMMEQPIYALVDCNNFYASCERVFRPSLRDKPVIVLSNNDGCAIARSNEAKALGIAMGAPLHEIQDIVRQHNVAVFSSNYQLYGDMSARVMESLRHFCPDMEVYSIDEAFFRLDGFRDRDLTEFCSHIRQAVLQWTGIPISIGIAHTKTLAKVANHIAKKRTVTGVFEMLDPNLRTELLKKWPVEELWGVGRKWSVALRMLGIGTAWQFKNADIRMIRKRFSVVGERIARELQGISCLQLEEVKPKQQIICSRSFGQLQKKIEPIEEAVSNFAARGGEKLRSQKSVAQGIQVFVTTNRFRLQDAQYANSALITFPIPTSDTAQLVKAAKKGLQAIFQAGYNYKKAGIMLMDILPETQQQGHLFLPSALASDPRRAALMTAIDKTNAHMGKNTIFLAAQGTKLGWQPRSDQRSPRYTTQWTELLRVH